MLPSSAGIPNSFPNGERSYFNDALKYPDAIIILYLHGNGGDRAGAGRLALYKLLRSLNYHVIAIDYRNYGDSDKIAVSEDTVVADALKIYEYITDKTDRPVFIWGHSLGSAIATHMCSDLQRMAKPSPKGVILEAPLNNMQEELKENGFGNIMSYHPLYKFGVTDAMYENKIRFESDKHILEFSAPVMILHARDDVVVPYELGHRLYTIGSTKRLSGTGPVEMHSFDESRELGHMDIYKAPELKDLVQEFVYKYEKKKFANNFYIGLYKP
ncbi:lysophosphatidylserine lipase ABHD12-like [Drosophila ananassae]|uniref:lysophosphatidylserine lipase ABHD12-like n=1 Tax=Drosophila ananassae TaxID=7217 RepID=UPI001CFFD862|nr:lysophosphatidylserine lipase ABHD12-like [Drosophila ananassae]